MTIQESIRMQERFAKKVQPILTALNSGTQFYKSADILAQSFSSTYALISDITPATSALSQAQQNIMNLCSNINYAGIEAALNAVGQLQRNLTDSISLFDSPSYQPLLNSLSATLEQVEPYLPPEKKEECETIIKPQLKEKTHKRLTLSDALSILNILFSILFFVLGSMPDKQAERIIQQQDKIIANQEVEIAQLREDDQALLDTLNSLSDSINLLTDEIELLRDELEDSDDLPDGPSQTDPGNPQQQHGDTQD